jgi:hypothetical protein
MLNNVGGAYRIEWDAGFSRHRLDKSGTVSAENIGGYEADP